MAQTKSKVNEFLVFVRDLCILVVLGAALAAGGYLYGKTQGHNQALAERQAANAVSAPKTGDHLIDGK